MAELVHLGVAEGVATLTLNRPEKRNAIDRALLEALHGALGQVRDDPGARVVVLRGEGKAFSSGIDHSLLIEVFAKSQDVPFRHVHGDLRRVMAAMTAMEKPIIAVLHGASVGLGFELALAADFRIALAGCVMGLPEVAFGIIPDVGGTTRLTRLVGVQKSKELILTGRLFSAQYAMNLGVLTALANDESELGEALADLSGRLAAHPPAAVGLGKALIERVADADLDAGLQLEGVYQSILLARPDLTEHFASAMAFIQSEWKSPMQ